MKKILKKLEASKIKDSAHFSDDKLKKKQEDETKKMLEVRPNEIAAFIGETGIKAKARIQKTMQRMLESNDLLKGSEFGTYKIFSQLPIKNNNINFEVDKIN